MKHSLLVWSYRGPTKIKFRNFYTLIRRNHIGVFSNLIFTLPEQTVKCKMFEKKYISQDTFLASYHLEQNKKLFVPAGMHVSVM
jgi:hypothetical protein